MEALDKLDEQSRERVTEYIERMQRESRCIQCIYPWYDGICECGQTGQEQEDIANIVYAVLLNG